MALGLLKRIETAIKQGTRGKSMNTLMNMLIAFVITQGYMIQPAGTGTEMNTPTAEAF